MNVVYLITKGTWGGAQRYVYDLIANAKEHGYNPVLAFGKHGLLVERVIALGIPAHKLSGLTRDVVLINDIWALVSIIRLLRKIRPQVVHLNSSKAGFIGALAARIVGVPRIIFTVHGWAFTEQRSWLSKLAFRLLQKITVLLAHQTITVSEALISIAREAGISTKHMGAIYLGIHEPTFLSRNEARAVLMAKQPALEAVRDTFWIGTIAELHKNKGLDVGIRAVQKLPTSLPHAWIIIGTGDERVRLAQQAAQVPAIHFMGFVPDAAQYMKAFDLFLLPSRTEALAYVILEAGMAKVPVVATNVGGISEATGYPIAALARPEDAGALAAFIHTYMREPETLKKTGVALHARVVSTFRLERMIAQTFAQY